MRVPCNFFRNLRSRQDVSGTGKRTFRYSGAILFNSLPETYKRAESLKAFKRLMIKYDFVYIFTVLMFKYFLSCNIDSVRQVFIEFVYNIVVSCC